MDTKDILMIGLFFFSGLAFLIGAGVAKQGGVKWMFLITPNPQVAVDIIYAFIPLGLGSILVAIGGLIDNVHITRWFLLIGLGGGVIVGFIFMAWKPRWLKPKWLLWIEKHYDEPTREFMFKQARKAGRAWNQQVATQVGLESWANEVIRTLSSRRH